MTLVDRAEVLERHGRAYGELRLAIGWTDGLQGAEAKRSRHWQSRPDRLADADHGAALLRGRGAARNPVVSLRASSVVGIDVDGAAGRDLLRRLVPAGFPPTVVVRSGRTDGGWHAWFRAPEGCRHFKIEFSAALELVADGYLVCPPALHGETGRPYVFAAGRAPWEIDLAVLPVELYEALAALRQRHDEAERADDASPVLPGGRHKHLLRLGCAMRRAGAGEATILAALTAENDRRCAPPQDDVAVRALAEDIATRYPAGVGR